MPRLHHIIDTCQIREYPDSTISNVLTILNWLMITTLNRKLLEKQRVKNRFASYEVHIGHFFYNINATVSFGNRLTLSMFRIFSPDRQTDKTNCLINIFAHAHVICACMCEVKMYVHSPLWGAYFSLIGLAEQVWQTQWRRPGKGAKTLLVDISLVELICHLMLTELHFNH